MAAPVATMTTSAAALPMPKRFAAARIASSLPWRRIAGVTTATSISCPPTKNAMPARCRNRTSSQPVTTSLLAVRLRVAAGDDRRALDRRAGVDRPREPHELPVRPQQRRGRAAARTARLAGRGPVIPVLFGQHQPVVRRAGDRAQPRPGVTAGQQLVLAALAGEQGPQAPACLALRVVEEQVPVTAVLLLPVAVEREAMPD